MNMERFLKKYAIAALAVILTIALVFGASLMMRGTDPVAQAGQQGDRVWTATPVLATAALGTDGAGSYTRGVAFPYDSNAQPVIFYLDATGNTAGDQVQVLGYNSAVTTYRATTLAFCGGNTTWIHCNNGMVGTTGVSWFAIDDGAGNVGWGEVGSKQGSGDVIRVISGASNMGCAAANTPDLSGVTFPVGSRVFPLVKLGIMPITTANANTAKDNDQGLFAASKGSPLLVLNQDTTTGVTIHTVTVKYQ
jgi:hypothetical protein